jgi:antagonist of KipI
VLSLLVDQGRHGHRHIGIGPGGAMDPFASRIANRLLSNDPNAPVLEFSFPAPEIEFLSERRFCLTGGDLDARLNGAPLPLWQVVQAEKGDILSFRALRQGFRSCLAVAGGFEAETWLGSRSTHLALGKGGHQGRALRKEDVVGFAEEQAGGHGEEFHLPDSTIRAVYDTRSPIPCLPGPEWDRLDEANRQALLSQPFRVHPSSNRMACLLSGPAPIRVRNRREMLSSAVLHGTVQLLPDGRLAVLMADHQTTGGFPRVLQVAESRFPRLAQAAPGTELRFTLLDPVAARADYLAYLNLTAHGHQGQHGPQL